MTSQEWRQRAGGNWMPANLGEIRSIAQGMLERGARFEAFVVTQTKTGELRLIWYWDLLGKLFSVESRAAVSTLLPSIVDIYCGADWAEREARDYYGVTFEGRASTPPLMLREADPPGVLLRFEGGPKVSYRIPLGPYHVALDEPYKIEVDCEGETITDAHIKVGFNFRGIEWLALRKNITRCIALMERVCGICSNVHSMTFCMALEQIGAIEIPKRAQYIRMVVAELERLHSHLLWAGVAAEIIGFQTTFMEVFRFRERVMDLLEAISGNRVNYSMNCIGGVNRDITDPESVIAGVREIRDTVNRVLIPVFTTDRTISARCRGVGVLSHADTIRYGAVGPVARASGVDTDLRRDCAYLAYAQIDFAVPIRTEGDVLARAVVRAQEIVESCNIIEQALAKMPSGSLNAGDIYAVPPGEAVVRVEAPRGEVFYYVESDGSDVPTRVKVRTPTFANIPSVMGMVKGNEFADMPLIQAALDPCYSCTDR